MAIPGKSFRNSENIIRKTHVQHSVGFVQYEEAHTAHIYISHLQVGNKSAGRGDYNVGSKFKTLHLLIVSVAIIASINRHTAHSTKIIGEALHGLINLLGQFACRRHDNTIDGILGIAPVIEFGKYGQQIGSCLTCTRLGNTHNIFSFKDWWNATLLNRRANIKMHVP